jgi:hypothetical protein
MTTDRSTAPSRVEVIGSVKSYLGFFVLVVLVVEVVLGTLAATTEGAVQLLALGGMLFIITGLVAIVAFFAYCRPDVLLKSLSASGSGDPSPHESKMLAFRDQICGCWWNRLEPRDPDRLAIAHITPDTDCGSVRLHGTSYDREGNVTAKWESVATCLHVNERKLFYYWRGSKPQAPKGRFEGFGEIAFHGTNERLHSANSMFSDTDLADVEKTVMKHARFWRLTEADAAVLSAGDPAHISRLIRERFAD